MDDTMIVENKQNPNQRWLKTQHMCNIVQNNKKSKSYPSFYSPSVLMGGSGESNKFCLQSFGEFSNWSSSVFTSLSNFAIFMSSKPAKLSFSSLLFNLTFTSFGFNFSLLPREWEWLANCWRFSWTGTVMEITIILQTVPIWSAGGKIWLI